MTERKFKDLKPGEKFKYGDIEFIALGEEQGGILAVAVEPLRNIPFDINDKNDWRKSSLRYYLNGDYLDKLDMSGLMEYESDLTSDDGMTDYGTCWDLIFLLSADLYRKYRNLLPKWGMLVWLITPYSCHKAYDYLIRVIDTDGSLHNGVADRGCGVVPACLFDPEAPLKRDLLKPCPFCGDDNPIIVTHEFSGYKWSYQVRCRKCEAATCLCETREKAKNAWNTRKEH